MRVHASVFMCVVDEVCVCSRALAREGERESVFILIRIHFKQNIFDLPKVSISFKREPNRRSIMDRNEVQKQNRRQQFFYSISSPTT